MGELPAAPKHVSPSQDNSNRSPSRSSESEFSVYSCISDASEMDSEDGGVALEGAGIEARAPDRCAVNGGDAGVNGLEDSKASIYVQTTSFEIEDEGDGGLEHVMAQV